MRPPGCPGAVTRTLIRLSTSLYGNGSNTTLYIAVVAIMPRASITTASAANPRLRPRYRNAKRTSRMTSLQRGRVPPLGREPGSERWLETPIPDPQTEDDDGRQRNRSAE